jgi:segregation and condensation protein B
MSGRDLSDKAEREQAAAELEALLFAANRPLAPGFLAKRIYIEESQAVGLLRALAAELEKPSRGLQLREAAGKWRLETKPGHEEVIASLRVERGEKPLSQPALEALAVVALRQPVTTEEVTVTRGIDSTGTLDTLRRRRLIVRAEQRGTAGRAAHWRTTQHFLEQFGLASLEELYRGGRLEKLFEGVYKGS